MPRDEERPLPPWVYNTAKSTFFNTSLSWLHLPNRWQLWQPPKLFLFSLRTVPPVLLGSWSCSSLNSPLREVLLCFFQNTAQAGSSRHRNILFQLPAHLQQPTARSYSLRWARSKCSDGAGSSTRSAAQRERTRRFESVKSERKKIKKTTFWSFSSVQ